MILGSWMRRSAFRDERQFRGQTILYNGRDIGVLYFGGIWMLNVCSLSDVCIRIGNVDSGRGLGKFFIIILDDHHAGGNPRRISVDIDCGCSCKLFRRLISHFVDRLELHESDEFKSKFKLCFGMRHHGHHVLFLFKII